MFSLLRNPYLATSTPANPKLPSKVLNMGRGEQRERRARVTTHKPTDFQKQLRVTLTRAEIAQVIRINAQG